MPQPDQTPLAVLTDRPEMRFAPQGTAALSLFLIEAGADLPARIDARVEQVVQNVRRHAETYGLPPDLVEKLWRRLIDWSIAREESRLGPDSLRKG